MSVRLFWSFEIVMLVVLTVVFLLASLYGHLVLAGLKQPLAYAGLAAVTAAYLAFLGVMMQRGAAASGASRAMIASVSARHIAFVWLFGAMALFLVYGYALSWREWLTFGFVMVTVAALSYLLGIMFAKDAAAGKFDPAMLGFGRTLNIVQVAGVVIAMVGLVIDRKMAVALSASRSDWAANTTFFTGAAAIAVIGVVALILDSRVARSEAPSNGRPGGGPDPSSGRSV